MKEEKRDYNTWIRYSALSFLATKTKRKHIKLHSFHFLTKRKNITSSTEAKTFLELMEAIIHRGMGFLSKWD